MYRDDLLNRIFKCIIVCTCTCTWWVCWSFNFQDSVSLHCFKTFLSSINFQICFCKILWIPPLPLIPQHVCRRRFHGQHCDHTHCSPNARTNERRTLQLPSHSYIQGRRLSCSPSFPLWCCMPVSVLSIASNASDYNVYWNSWSPACGIADW